MCFPSGRIRHDVDDKCNRIGEVLAYTLSASHGLFGSRAVVGNNLVVLTFCCGRIWITVDILNRVEERDILRSGNSRVVSYGDEGESSC